MASPAFEQAVREILDRANIVNIVSEYVQLKRYGKSYKGLCPFHVEKTPSFFVNEEKKVFYCFGCQTGGNIITFLKLAEGVSGREAIQKLAEITHVSLPQDEKPDPLEEVREREKSDLLYCARIAVDFFVSSLKGPYGHIAKEYISGRGIPKEVSQIFALGYGGVREGELLEELRKRGISFKIAEWLGVITRSESTGQYRERFKGRLVCPIFNLDGLPIGFSARTIPPKEDGPKYINSPDSPIFRKGEELFGLYQAKKAIKQMGYAILVEGNFDLLSLYSAGIENVVAPMGTSVTVAQMRLLRRFTDTVIVMFDGDSAGRKASRRAVGILIETGLNGKIAILPEGDDPDSYVRKYGAKQILKLIENARPMITYVAEELSKIYGKTPHGIRKVVEDVKELIAFERDTFRYGLYREEIARCLGVDVRIVRNLLRDPSSSSNTLREEDYPPVEKKMLELLLLHPNLVEKLVTGGYSNLFTDIEARDIVGELIDIVIGKGVDPAEEFARYLGESKGLRTIVARVLTTPEKYPADKADLAFDELISLLRRKQLEREEKRLIEDLKNAEAQGASDEVIASLQIQLSRAVAQKRFLGKTDL